MSIHGGWTGWDIIERYYGRVFAEDEDAVVELSADTVATALLVEIQRPPWWREIDANRRALAKEIG